MAQKQELITKIDIELPNGQTQQMIIEKKKDGDLKSVTDKNGVKFHEEIDPDAIKLTHEKKDYNGNPGHFRSNVISVRDGTLLVTQGSPTCGWYYMRGRWYWLCW